MVRRTILIVAILTAIPNVAKSDNKPDPEWGCEMSRFKSDGTKEDTIKKIFALRDCIREQQRRMKNGRCRMHGGTSPGAPKGNMNAYKHGHYTADAIARRRSIATLIRTGKKLTADIHGGS
jgi:hypothetical protein